MMWKNISQHSFIWISVTKKSKGTEYQHEKCTCRNHITDMVK